jgi:hypothetical protein
MVNKFIHPIQTPSVVTLNYVTFSLKAVQNNALPPISACDDSCKTVHDIFLAVTNSSAAVYT